METRNADDAPPNPAPGAVTRQTPPDFRWPFQKEASVYVLQIADANGKISSYSTAWNWYTPTKALTPGHYRWKVGATKPASSPATSWSDWREFTIAADATKFLLPAGITLSTQLASLPHPRSFPKDAELAALRAMLNSSRTKDWQTFLERSQQAMQLAMPTEPVQPLNLITDKNAWAAALEELPNRVRPALTLTAEAAFAWRMTGDPVYLAEAKRRALALAKWNPAGSTSWVSQDQMTREFGYILALAYDWLYPDLSSQERTILASAAYQRLRDIDAHIDGIDHSLARQPANSHGWTALSVAAAVSALLAGDMPDAGKLAGKLIPWYYNSISPWGGEEGGHANGTAYGVWTFQDTAITWDILRRTVGLDPAQKSWPQGMVEFLAYMLPPGAPQNVFGDAAEWAPVIQIAKRFLRRVDHPLARWYDKQTFGEDGSELWLLSAPFGPADGSALPSETTNARFFPSVGMAAMHSDLAARNRMSVYFKSSPYGTFSHGHAEHNGFVIHAHGKPVLVASGHYDYWGSPHWSDWYIQTRAHNAITFDGGEGQAVNSRGAAGRIVQFATSPEIDAITGDASAAYQGRLETALRTLIYIRPGTVVVIDRLRSTLPRSWEWNIHSLNEFRIRGPGQLSVMDTDKEILCADMLQPQLVRFQQNHQYRIPPADSKPPLWDGIFTTEHRTQEAVFVARLTLDCQSPVATVEDNGSAGFRVRSGESRINVKPDGTFTLD